MKTAFLIASALIMFASVVPYVRDMVRGRTRPNLVSWITWTMLTAIITAAELAAHEYTAAIFSASATVETTVIVVMGLRYGFVKYSRFDFVCQLGALAGIVLWRLFDSPAAAIVALVIVDSIGALPTVRHAWLRPREETISTYVLAALSGGLAIGALSTYTWSSLIYAVYIVVIDLVIVTAIIGGRAFKLAPTSIRR